MHVIADKVTWMIRNEDFFLLRWGGADFIREHIATNGHPYVGGYAIGSEGNIPAFDYSEKDSKGVWMFEKQWLFYSLWGRLLYDPTAPDATFGAMFEARYPGALQPGDGLKVFQAYGEVSVVPLKICSFVYNTWDYTLHAEGFLQVRHLMPT